MTSLLVSNMVYERACARVCQRVPMPEGRKSRIEKLL